MTGKTGNNQAPEARAPKVPDRSRGACRVRDGSRRLPGPVRAVSRDVPRKRCFGGARPSSTGKDPW